MIEFVDFYQLIAKGSLSHSLDKLPSQLSRYRCEAQQGKFKSWLNTVAKLPTFIPNSLDLLRSVHADISPALSRGQREGIEKRLRALIPWRKSPFFLYGIDINTEWKMATGITSY